MWKRTASQNSAERELKCEYRYRNEMQNARQEISIVPVNRTEF